MTAAFLAQAGFGAARLDPLPSDASARRYTRLLGGPRPALLMEAPPPENTRPFIAIAGHIRGLGLSAPEIIAADPDQGLVLLEDFGDATHAALLDGGADAPALYAEAAEALAALHEAPPPPGLPAWDAAAMARATAATFLDWWWPAAMGAAPSDDLRAGLAAALHAMLAPFAGTRGFVHRDYFPANLMRLDRRAGAQRTGLLDFQDAGLGHPAYDLVSLIEDARRDVSPEVEARELARYQAETGKGADFEQAYWALGAQRNMRILGLFVRLWRRDGKPHYTQFQPRMWGLFERNLAHPALAPVRAWFDAHVPADKRAAYWAVPRT